ncbi:hypothetical protein F4803DRAFT_547470 [Xylaria telfairii]|nr:hypothetical protein F4803DRAFT_547470 [Xylaria telfairii]
MAAKGCWVPNGAVFFRNGIFGQAQASKQARADALALVRTSYPARNLPVRIAGGGRGLSFDVMIGSSGADRTPSSVARRSETPLGSQEHGNVASGLNTEQASRPLSHPAAASRPGHTQTLWILIFKGQPQDIQSARITELYIAFDEDERTNVTIRVQGEYPNFRAQEEWNQPLPWMRPNFFRRLAVSTFTTAGRELEMRVRNAIWGTPVNNRELDYSCQIWVGDVVTVLQEANLITAEEGDNALNGMVNYISQAPWR